MEERTIEVSGKKITVHELLAKEFDELQKIEDKVEGIVKLIKMSSSLSDEEYSRLTLKERTKIMEAINELNGWVDFQKSETVEKAE